MSEEQTEFTFDQLSDAVKAKVRDANRYCDVEYDQWWDAVYEYAVTVGAKIGIEIGVRNRRIVDGRFIPETDISFSGFYSQGDGCCFSGQLRIAALKDCVAALHTHVGEGTDNDLSALALCGEALYAQIVARLMEVRMLGGTQETGEFDEEVELDNIVLITGYDRNYRTTVDLDAYTAPPEIEAAADAYVSDFADWIYSQLEAEYDYLTSDDYLDQWLSGSEKKFDEDGNEV